MHGHRYHRLEHGRAIALARHKLYVERLRSDDAVVFVGVFGVGYFCNKLYRKSADTQMVVIYNNVYISVVVEAVCAYAADARRYVHVGLVVATILYRIEFCIPIERRPFQIFATAIFYAEYGVEIAFIVYLGHLRLFIN